MTGTQIRRSDLWLWFIILLAFGLRLYAIDRQDIWGDEAFSIWLSGQPLPEVVAGGADTHPPLYPFLLYLWQRLAGASPLAVRFLSAGIGTLTVPVVYVLGRQALAPRSRWAARLAALLTALSPALVYYSQETRMYGLVTLLAAASVYWALLAWRDGSRALIPYLLSTLGAVYTHYYAFFVVAAENLIVVAALLRRRRWPALGRWLAVQGAIVLAYLPWIAVQRDFLSGKASTRFEEWDLVTALRIAAETLTSFSSGLAVSAPLAGVITALFVATVLAGIWHVWRRQQPEPWLIVAYLLVPLALVWAVNPIMPFFFARYLLLIAPAFCLLAAGGLVALRCLWRPLAAAAALLLLTASGYGLASYYTDEVLVRGRYGQMMAYVEAQAQPGDGLLLANPLQKPIFEYYRPQGLEAYFFPRHGYPLEDPRTARDLAAIAGRHPRLWLVRFGNPAEYDPDGSLTRWLATHGSKAYFDGWVDADLSLYVMTPAGAGEDTIQHPLQVDLGGVIRLLGYDLNTERLAPGDTLLLTLHWLALQPMDEAYTVFTHLLDAENQIQAQMDSQPQGGGLPTDRWLPGQEVADNYALLVADEAPPGTYYLEVGVYLLETLDRLPVTDAAGTPLGDRVLLGTVQVGD